MEPTQEKSVGPILAIIIVLLLVVLGGLYFLGQRKSNVQSSIESASVSGDTSQITASIKSQSSSDDSTSLEQDLNNTNTTNVDSGVSNI